MAGRQGEWEGGGSALASAARSCATRPVTVVCKPSWPGCGAAVVVSPRTESLAMTRESSRRVA